MSNKQTNELDNWKRNVSMGTAVIVMFTVLRMVVGI